jgi:hypothetical protein
VIEESKRLLAEAKRTGAIGIMVPVSELEYLIGEVERLQAIDERESEIAISIRNKNQQLQKALEEANQLLELSTKYGQLMETMLSISAHLKGEPHDSNL